MVRVNNGGQVASFDDDIGRPSSSHASPNQVDFSSSTASPSIVEDTNQTQTLPDADTSPTDVDFPDSEPTVSRERTLSRQQFLTQLDRSDGTRDGQITDREAFIETFNQLTEEYGYSALSTEEFNLLMDFVDKKGYAVDIERDGMTLLQNITTAREENISLQSILSQLDLSDGTRDGLITDPDALNTALVQLSDSEKGDFYGSLNEEEWAALMDFTSGDGYAIEIDGEALELLEHIKTGREHVQPEGGVNAKLPVPEQQTFEQRLRVLASTIDSDDNGFISQEELLQKLQDPSIQGADAALVAALFRYIEDLEELHDDEFGDENDGITLQDFQNLATDETLSNYLNWTYEQGLTRLEQYSDHRDHQGHLLPPQDISEINHLNLEQGANGDCYFLAALDGLAYHRPQEIIDMIQTNEDGTFTVQFGEESVTIEPPTDAELALYARESSGQPWVAIIEKAYALYRNENRWFDYDNPYDASSGGLLSQGINHATGSSTDTDFLDVTFPTTMFDTTREKIQEAVDNNKIVTLGIPPGGNDLNLPDGHAYTVLDYDDETGLVTIRNPWGHGEVEDDEGHVIDGSDDGVFQLPVEFIHMYFHSITYEE